jgi:hypothetical protein
MGARVPREAVDELVGLGKVEAVLEYEEREIRVWHLRVYWRARPNPSIPLPGAGRGNDGKDGKDGDS